MVIGASGDGLTGFLHCLGRALRQLRTYPPEHAQSVEAIAACRKSLIGLSGADELIVRVTEGALSAGDQSFAPTTAGDQLLIAQLQRARVSELTISRHATARDLSRFCVELLGAADTRTSLAELLAEHGVSTIAVQLVPRPELLDVLAPAGGQLDLLEHERRRQEALAADRAGAAHLYPRDKGWVRVDPSLAQRTFSLTDLAVLVDDPSELADMLARLSDEPDDPAGEGRSALERRFSDVARLFAALDPRLGRVMFARLARAVLDMEPAERERLLRETVLTGLLDGDVEAAILHEFPDPTLAESLCLLLDLETAGPEVMSTAMDRLALSPERRSTLEPLVDAQVQKRRSASGAAATSAELDWYARRLTRISNAPGTIFSDFAAFDLSMNSSTQEELAGVRHAIHATDPASTRIVFLTNLLRVEPNPDTAAAFLQSLLAGLHEVWQASRLDELAAHIAPLRALAEDLREGRPEVASEITAALAGFATRDVAHTLIEAQRADSVRRPAATALIEALGETLVPPFLLLLGEPLPPPTEQALTELMSRHSAAYASALVPRLDGGLPDGVRARVIAILGHAGPGVEDAINQQLHGADEHVTREALRALARIGSPVAAGHIAHQLTHGPASLSVPALEALLRLPQSVADRHMREALARTDLATRHPALMRVLMDRAARGGTSGIRDSLAALARLRLRFWNPAAARLGRRAHALLKS